MRLIALSVIIIAACSGCGVRAAQKQYSSNLQIYLRDTKSDPIPVCSFVAQLFEVTEQDTDPFADQEGIGMLRNAPIASGHRHAIWESPRLTIAAENSIYITDLHPYAYISDYEWQDGMPDARVAVLSSGLQLSFALTHTADAVSISGLKTSYSQMVGLDTSVFKHQIGDKLAQFPIEEPIVFLSKASADGSVWEMHKSAALVIPLTNDLQHARATNVRSRDVALELKNHDERPRETVKRYLVLRVDHNS
jgi:hypothetical protein